MTTKLLLFILGLAVGYALHGFIHPTQEAGLSEKSPPCTNEEPEPAREQEERPVPAPSVSHSPREAHFEKRNLELRATMRTVPANTQTSLGVRTTESKTVDLSFDEPIVREWEYRLEQLRSYVSTAELQEGWRVHVLQSDPLITRTGLQDGDLITYESLQTQLSIPERAGLANRFQGVLRALRR